MSSVGISTIARAIVYPDSDAKMISIIECLAEYNVPFLVLGRMSNVLFKNALYNGVIVKTTKFTQKHEAENYVTLSCGMGLAKVLKQISSKNLGGLEGLWGIPGTVGGMVRQNAGAFGYEVADRFKEAICYIPKAKSICKFSKEDMRFAYRESILGRENIVLISATFEFIPKSYECVIEEINSYRSKRSETQPIEYPSLGSVFKRHGGVSAGFYVDKAGLKGYSVGGARISDKHAGFIINTGNATADDYLKIIDQIKSNVYSAFGIELEEEIEIIS